MSLTNWQVRTEVERLGNGSLGVWILEVVRVLLS